MAVILITDHSPDFFIKDWQRLGFEIDYQPDISPEKFQEVPNQYEAVLIKSALTLDTNFLDKHSRLELILRPGSGLDNVALEYAESKGIQVINSPEGNCEAVGEFAVGSLISMLRGLNKTNEQVRRGEWIREGNRGRELSELTVGVIGVGNTGTAFIRKLRGFEPAVLAYDKYKSQFPGLSLEPVALNQLFQFADVISLHLPLNEETNHYANEVFFNSFQRPIYFLNMSRGGVCDLNALFNALDTGRVTTAALDVLEPEPLEAFRRERPGQFERLQQDQRILLSPHIAGWTYEAKRRMFSLLTDKFQKTLD